MIIEGSEIMLKQGSIIWVDLNPTKGHEQKGLRPALVISNDDFNRFTKLTKVVAITTSNNGFPLHKQLPDGLQTVGFVEVEQERTLDLSTRKATLVEMAPTDFVSEIIEMVKEAY